MGRGTCRAGTDGSQRIMVPRGGLLLCVHVWKLPIGHYSFLCQG